MKLLNENNLPPEQAQRWAKEQIDSLTNGVLDDYNKGIHTIEDVKLFFKEREGALKVWKLDVKKTKKEKK